MNLFGNNLPSPSRGSLYWALVIVLSASFTRPVLNTLNASIGRAMIANLLWLGFILCGCLLVYLMRRGREIAEPQFLPVLLVSISLLFFALSMDIPEERVHLLNFGFLGWLLASDAHALTTRRAIVYALIGGTLVAGLDEGFQAFLPNRFADIRDVAFGAIGALHGALLAVLTTRPTS